MLQHTVLQFYDSLLRNVYRTGGQKTGPKTILSFERVGPKGVVGPIIWPPGAASAISRVIRRKNLDATTLRFFLDVLKVLHKMSCCSHAPTAVGVLGVLDLEQLLSNPSCDICR